ncbi:hypothetical protein GCM10022223_43810 [Kineosporia mesophila]|uniref:Uncharacterized protein n=1 Tax=Kineosporia mesophila TaxID=566012 RepID=A0ABP6ZXH7_9ACTN|nr:hypothetical protein [Kineosporia mesophila]MCD5348808.1 hypothetical protein [Kineosporia mesophila]
MANEKYNDGTLTIKIDEGALRRLQSEYTDLAAEFKKRAGEYGWSDKGNVTIAYPFYLQMGGASFEEAKSLIKALEKVRGNLLERFQLTYGDADGLSVGLKSLLAETDLAEELNGMTADEFGAYIQKSSASLAPTES